MATTFGRSIGWGVPYIMCNTQLDNLKAWSANASSRAAGASDIVDAIEGLKAGQVALKASVVEMRQTLEKNECLELIHDANRLETGAPFGSAAKAEQFLSQGENMDVCKQVFAKTQAVLQSLERNEERRQKRAKPMLDTYLVVNYLFRRSALKDLADVDNFRSVY